MQPITVISNRAPYQLKRKFGQVVCEKNAGGLVSVLDEVMRQSGGAWIAWGEKGETPDSVGIPIENPRYSLRLVRLTEEEVQHYYYGFSNRIVWPLSHYFLDRCHFETEYWNGYQAVNQKFAKVYGERSSNREPVWIHDFHLTLLPGLLRRDHPDFPIGFFWHIPFPASPVFRILPWREEILRGILGSDLVGFHLPLHADHFLQCVEDVLKIPVDRQSGAIRYEGRLIRVSTFPVGVDFQRWDSLATQPALIEKALQLRQEVGTGHILLGVDRLDYTKGIRERLLAYERFLEKHAEFHGRVCMIQIAVPSRTRVDEYKSLRREIDEMIGRITGRFSTRKWIPLRYLYQSFDMEDIATYYVAADVALITPLRDGMNLVAKEYVACRRGEDGTLVLSEFTGAAGTLTEAILVNPYNIEGLAETIRLALAMPEEEKKRRMRNLREKVRDQDVYWWCDSFLKNLFNVGEERL